MMKKIYALTDWVIATPKRSWWTMVGILFAVGIISMVGSLFIPGVDVGSVIGTFLRFMFFGFISYMINGAFLTWASHLMGFERKTFSLALGGMSAYFLVLLIPMIIVVALSPLIIKGAISIIFWLALLGLIVWSIIALVHVFARTYNTTKGKAFAVFATSKLLAGLIVAAIFLVMIVVAAPFVSEIATNSPFAEIDFEAYNSLEIEMDESSFGASGSGLLEIGNTPVAEAE